VKPKAKKTTGLNIGSSTEPDKPKQKKPYRPPGFKILTPDQAKLHLTEKALPGEVAAGQLLREASGERPDGTKEQQRSMRGKAKSRSGRVA
jgi:hypothetical protein